MSPEPQNIHGTIERADQAWRESMGRKPRVPTTKQCRECGKTKTLMLWNNGNRCTACYSKMRRKYTVRTCSRCLLVKELTSWHKNNVCGACYSRDRNASDPSWHNRRLAESVHRLTKNPNARYKHAISRAKARGHAFTLSEEEYTALVSQPCFYCSGDLPVGGTALDRIDNDYGYVRRPDGALNVVPCCTDCNILRQDRLSVDECTMLVYMLQRWRGRTDIWRK